MNFKQDCSLDQMKQRLRSSISFDFILDNRIGFGLLQRRLALITYLLLLSEGTESLIISMIVPSLIRQWQLQNFKLLIITFVYFGVSLGSLVQYKADQIGRIKMMAIAASLQAVLGVLSALSSNQIYFLTVRFLYGIGIGIVLPLSGTFLTEISPSSLRTYTLGWSRIYFSAGCCLAVAVAWLFLDESSSGNQSWRLLLLLSSIPGIVVCWMLFSNYIQSPRYLLIRGQNQRALQIIRSMMEGKALNKQQQQGLLDWGEQQKIRQQRQLSYTQLFNQKYLGKTVVLTYNWIVACIVYYNLNFVLPLILKGIDRNFKYLILFLGSTVQTLSTVICISLIDCLGRKKSLIIFTTVCGFTSLLLQLYSDPKQNVSMFLICVIIIKFFIIAVFIVLYPYTSQTYQTMLRSKSMSFVNVVSRMSISLMGFVMGALLQLNIQFLLMGLLCFGVAILTYILNHQTKGKQLDE